MKEIYLHIGLHKTATKFFQHKLFTDLNGNKVFYNPPKLTQLCCDLIKAEQTDLPLVLDNIKEEREKLETGEHEKILISREVMSGNLFSFYKDFDQTVAKLKTAFPDAKIICFLRFQTQWILSCYRETVHEHHYQTLDQFLSGRSNTAFVSNDYRDLDFNKITRLLKENFGDNVRFFFFENFKEAKQETIRDVLADIGVPFFMPVEDNIPNRGYSAFAINLSLLRYRVFKTLRLEKHMVHRPIRFLGPGSIPCGFENLSVLPKNKYWGNEFLRDNEEVRSDDWPDLKGWQKLRYLLSWRHIVKNGIDKLFYLDWDILKEKRKELDRYFKKQNARLASSMGISEDKIPDEYL